MTLTGLKTLDHTVLLCRDIERTRIFYRDILGLQIETDLPYWISFCVGSSFLTLRPRCTWSVCDDGEIPEGSASVQLAFRVPPAVFDEWYKLLKAKEVEILQQPTELPEWRHNTLFFRDPEGNILEIYAEI